MPYHKKRRKPAPNKNELKIGRQERESLATERAGTLRSRFPQVEEIRLSLKMDTAAGATLEQVDRKISLDEPLQLDVPCQGGCGNGVFLLTDALTEMVTTQQDSKQGLGLCQGASYLDPRSPCATKLYYRIDISYR